jgi:hypothetical protein
MSGSTLPNDSSTIQMSSGGYMSPVGVGYYPPEGSRVLTTRYNFATQTSFYEDLSFSKALGIETAIQSLYIDNSQNAYTATIQIEGSNQFIIVPPASIVTAPAFFTDNAAFTISSGIGGGFTRVHMLNVPLGSMNFSTYNPQLTVNSNGAQVPTLAGTFYQAANFNNTGSQTLINPGPSKRWFLSSLYVALGENATITGGGEINFTILDGGITVFSIPIYIPAAAQTITGNQILFNQSGLNIISSITGNLLRGSLSGPLTTGLVNVTVTGGSTTYSQ